MISYYMIFVLLVNIFVASNVYKNDCKIRCDPILPNKPTEIPQPTNGIISISLVANKEEIFEKQKLVITCNVTHSTKVNIRWYLNVRPIKSSKRVSIHSTKFSSQLQVDPVLIKDSGLFRCKVKFSKKINLEKIVTIIVHPLPISYLWPRFVKVDGEPQNKIFNVFLVNFYVFREELQYNWYVNGSLIETGIKSSISLLVDTSFTLECRVKINELYEIKTNKVNIEYISYQGDCQSDLKNGHTWGPLGKGREERANCSSGSEGFMTRKCRKEGVWGRVNKTRCLSKRLMKILEQVEDAKYDITGLEAKTLANISMELRLFVDTAGDDDEDDVVDVIYQLAMTREDADNEVEDDEGMFDKEVDYLMQCVGGMLKKFGKKKQQCQKGCSLRLLRSINVYANTKFNQDNLIVQPDKYLTFERQMLTTGLTEASFPDWNNFKIKQDSCISLLPNFFNKLSASQNYYASSSFAENLAEFLPTEKNDSFINSGLISLDVTAGMVDVLGMDGDYFVQYTMQHLQPTDANSTSSCVFWKFDGKLGGRWATEGCQMVSSNSSHTTCLCNHLTNFAILLSPNQILSELNSRILSIISLVGCIISLVALVLTVVYYAVLWRNVKSKRAVLVLNLCVALIFANVVLLIEYGVPNPTEAGCKTLAILLHFFFLAAFFAMLAISIHLLLSVFYVFLVLTKRSISTMVVLSWILPLVIVVISMGVTRLGGYGSRNNCWLSVDGGLLWAFVGPALVIIAFNTIVVVAVLVRVCGMKSPNPDNEKRNKIRSAVRNLFILNPILGLTWVFGVLSVNENLVVFQYIFTIINSLQGLFIFLLYALCHKASRPKMAKSKRAVEKIAKRQTPATIPELKDTSGTYEGLSSSSMSPPPSENLTSLSELQEDVYMKLENTQYHPIIKKS